ncbi:MAG TPA: hypothetical protein VMW83_11375 [Spirochaetia bacterium]|nr:hypothetical protein [Spirochaetia bacterium]
MENRDLCLALMKADTEQKVIDVLKSADYWDRPEIWRFFGNYENNYNSIGNQQSRPEAALVEKLVNSIDARLMCECILRGISPEEPEAPQTIREAVGMFFGDNVPHQSATAGLISNWSSSKRTDVSRGVTVAATGYRPNSGYPSITISDCGEGQTPQMIPHTFMSLTDSNKLRIPFVQGKFNMGGTGALKFCGHHNIQLILTRRNPGLLREPYEHHTDADWGFTVVRREDPQGSRRSSVYKYLAPLGVDENNQSGQVLHFFSPTMPIFPNGAEPNEKDSEWGTLIKLYEYACAKSHILMKDGLLGHINILLPYMALPVRLHECREGYKGKPGSYETTASGLVARLDDNKAENIEDDFPTSHSMSVMGESALVTVYAFKKKRDENYRNHEGVIFLLNGQTHGHFTKDFFRRNKVGLSTLSDSILVLVDCSSFSGRAREDLFMNSRDRLSSCELKRKIEESLEEILKDHPGLRALKEKRRNDEVTSQLFDSKPLISVLKSILRSSPSLSALFLEGKQLSNPFKPAKTGASNDKFKGKTFPTYFRFKGKEYRKELTKECHINLRCRIHFDTDAANDYLTRDTDPGTSYLHAIIDDENKILVDSYSLSLYNGAATLSVKLPETCSVGDAIKFQLTVSDSSRVMPFQNTFAVHVKEASETKSNKKGGGRNGTKPPGKDDGHDSTISSGIALPDIKLVNEDGWASMSPPFDKFSALRVRNDGEDGDSNQAYRFYINMDNIYLKTEMKSAQNDRVLEARFEHALVLIGLSLLHYDLNVQEDKSKSEDTSEHSQGENIEDRIESFSKAIAPVILPLIASLGALDVDTIPVGDAIGEAV